jgi:hypothetical protein
MYDAYEQWIAECDQALEQHLRGVADKAAAPSTVAPSSTTSHHQARSGPKRRRKAGSHAPQFDLSRELFRISGVDLTRIDGIDVGVAQTVISEVGLDMSRWANEHRFASWLGLCRQSHHRRQGTSPRHPARHQSCRHRPTSRRDHAAPQPELPRRAISPLPQQTGRPESHHCDGSQARGLDLPHAPMGSRVRR